VSIGVEVLKALGEAHAMDLVHRDLKPGNIFLQSLAGGARTAVKVLDFGVAKLLSAEGLESTLWPAGSPKGSPRYMSPEQILDEPVTPASDFYAFGATLYRSLCGEPVFGGGLAVMMQAHLDVPAQPLRDRFPRLGIPGRLDELLLQCLAKKPADRPTDAGALQAEFERLLRRPPNGGSSPPGPIGDAGGPDDEGRSGFGSDAPADSGRSEPGSRALLGPPSQEPMSAAAKAVNANVDPLEYTIEPLSMNAPSVEASSMAPPGNPPVSGGPQGPSSEEGGAVLPGRETRPPVRDSWPSGPLEASQPSRPVPVGPSGVQSAQRARPGRIPWELLISACVLFLGAGWYLLAGQAGETGGSGVESKVSVALDASARSRSLLTLDAAMPVVVVPDASSPAVDSMAPTVRVRVAPGAATFRVVETREIVCKQTTVCQLPIDVDIRVEKPGYATQVLTGDDLYDRRNGTWRVVLKRR